MAKAKITIVGVGALGSHVVLALRNHDGPIRVIDDDRVEMKNVSSQLHFKNGVGKKKVDSILAVMRFGYGRELEVVGHRLAQTNAEQLLGGSSLLIDCLDNAESRKTLQAYASLRGIPCLHGALAADGSFGRVAWDENFSIDQEPGNGVPTCEDGRHLPFIAMVSGHIACSAQRFLRDGRKLGFSISPVTVQTI